MVVLSSSTTTTTKGRMGTSQDFLSILLFVVISTWLCCDTMKESLIFVQAFTVIGGPGVTNSISTNFGRPHFLTTYIGRAMSAGDENVDRNGDDEDEATIDATDGDDGNSDNNNNNDDGRIDVSIDERLYRIRLSRAPGIDWGTDLSFSFVYVREMDPSGEASMSGLVSKGDQLCELIPVPSEGKGGEGSPSAEPINLLGAPFDFVMNAFAGLDRSISDVDLVFFRGTKDELKSLASDNDGDKDPEIITVTVIQNKGGIDEKIIKLQSKPGVNVRELLVENGINVYQSLTRWTNCSGQQLCGTCIVNISNGLSGTNWKSMDEASTLRENPDSYRLSCVTFAYTDITVETFPPIGAAQWTR